jgi:hypothetical protein
MPIDKTTNESKSSRLQWFSVHDLRRTFRTILSLMTIPTYVSELCINHRESSNGVLTKVSRYDRHIKLKERREAHDKLAEKIM